SSRRRDTRCYRDWSTDVCSSDLLEIRVPKDAAERELMWKGRKSAFAAVGRIARNYLVQDGVIPRSEIARVLQEIAALGKRYGLRSQERRGGAGGGAGGGRGG